METHDLSKKLDFFPVGLHDPTESIGLVNVSEEKIREFCDGLTKDREMWTEGILNPKIKNYGICVFDGDVIVAVGYFFLSKKYPPPMATYGRVVKKKYRNMGIGMKLLRLLEKLATKVGITRFRGELRNTNCASLWTNLKHGFRFVAIEEIVNSKGRTCNYIIEKNIGEDGYEYRRYGYEVQVDK